MHFGFFAFIGVKIVKWQTGNKERKMGMTCSKGPWLESNQRRCSYIALAIIRALRVFDSSFSIYWDFFLLKVHVWIDAARGQNKTGYSAALSKTLSK